jgi:flavin reductase (DIM6/NTAB) family NADH-FMN oxidoreductase RutF
MSSCSSTGGHCGPTGRHSASTASSNGLPVLADAQANIACLVTRIILTGTHSIVIGEASVDRSSGDVPR